MHLFLLFIRIFVIFTARVNWSQSRGVKGWRQWRARQCIRGLTQKDTYFQSHTRRLFRPLSLCIWTVRGKKPTEQQHADIVGKTDLTQESHRFSSLGGISANQWAASLSCPIHNREEKDTNCYCLSFPLCRVNWCSPRWDFLSQIFKRLKPRCSFTVVISAIPSAALITH